MIRYESRCVYCPPELSCRGSACPNYRVPVRVCDRCGCDEDEVSLSRIGMLELCDRCRREYLRTTANTARVTPERRYSVDR